MTEILYNLTRCSNNEMIFYLKTQIQLLLLIFIFLFYCSFTCNNQFIVAASVSILKYQSTQLKCDISVILCVSWSHVVFVLLLICFSGVIAANRITASSPDTDLPTVSGLRVCEHQLWAVQSLKLHETEVALVCSSL